MSKLNRTLLLLAVGLVLGPSAAWADTDEIMRQEDFYNSKVKVISFEPGPVVPPPISSPPVISPTGQSGRSNRAIVIRNHTGVGPSRSVGGDGLFRPTLGGLGSTPTDDTRRALKRLIRRLG